MRSPFNQNPTRPRFYVLSLDGALRGRLDDGSPHVVDRKLAGNGGCVVVERLVRREAGRVASGLLVHSSMRRWPSGWYLVSLSSACVESFKSVGARKFPYLAGYVPDKGPDALRPLSRRLHVRRRFPLATSGSDGRTEGRVFSFVNSPCAAKVCIRFGAKIKVDVGGGSGEAWSVEPASQAISRCNEWHRARGFGAQKGLGL